MGQLRVKKYWTAGILKTLCSLMLFFSAFPFVISAEELPTYRVFYRPDGGVSITHFVAEACSETETATECINRLAVNLSETRAEYPHDDLPREQLPTDRSKRDKWRGEKGRGIWVDESLITRNDKIAEIQTELETELDQPEPDPVKVLKYQRLLDRAHEIPRTILTQEDLGIFETQKQSIVTKIFGGIGNAIGSTVRGIRDGLLAVVSMVTQSLTVGTSSAPAGITAYDQVTGEANCIVIRNGQLTTVLGECTMQGTSSANVALPSVSSTGNTQTPPPSIPTTGEMATSSPALILPTIEATTSPSGANANAQSNVPPPAKENPGGNITPVASPPPPPPPVEPSPPSSLPVEPPPSGPDTTSAIPPASTTP